MSQDYHKEFVDNEICWRTHKTRTQIFLLGGGGKHFNSRMPILTESSSAEGLVWFNEYVKNNFQ